MFFKKGCIRDKVTDKKALFLLFQKQKYMFNFLRCCFFFLITLHVTGQNCLPRLKKGNWSGNLQLNENSRLPFKFVIAKKNKTFVFTIFNGEEKITLIQDQITKDSLKLSFPLFNSTLFLNIKSNSLISGYWQNLNKGVNYKIPCDLTSFSKTSHSSPLDPVNFGGKWESTFEPNTVDAYKATGLFNQNKSAINGTFLTETGDYRFLSGEVNGNTLLLSCFDGSHAFLFTGKMQNDSIYGSFFSGKHWETTWEARKNETFQLTNPDSLTFLVDTTKFHFELKDLQGNKFTFPNDSLEGKITIIQIMGTWCPNCMDETRYFKELKNKYRDQGLEIISIGYEVGDAFEEHSAKIASLQKRLDLDFIFLVGGGANKDLASEHFKMLSHIISFPTAIFIGRDGQIKKIHTGFSGPGTGEHYLNYMKETALLIESMLKVN